MNTLVEASLRRVASCPPVWLPFVDAGVLTATDVHVARTICSVLPCEDERVLLGVAMAARAPRVGHTCLDMDHVVDMVGFEVPGRDPEETEAALAALTWPAADAWLAALSASPVAGPAGDGLPLVIEGRLVFLRRQYEQEVALAADLRMRASAVEPIGDKGRLEATLGRLFPDGQPDDPQLLACRSAVLRRLSVLTGGPGTGKTWTVARILAVLVDQAQATRKDLTIALAAPTAKAAAQLSGQIGVALDEMDVKEEVRAAIVGVGRGQTIHGLLGRRTASRFWHDRDRPLPHDVLVIDETSMGSLSLMARLLEAVRPDARVILIGDPDQLPSVEAGSVLADIVDGLGGAAVTELTRPRRFGADSGIATLATAIREGGSEVAIRELRDRDDLHWIDTAEPAEADLAPIRSLIVDRARRMREAAVAGEVIEARRCLSEVVVLTPHRRGKRGVSGWNARIDRWLAADVPGWHPYEDWQPGRTVLATTNDRTLGVFNGDLGVVVATDDGPRLAFHDDPERLTPPARLSGHELVHAMTIHKSQGSQWDHVVLSLPTSPSRLMSRQLLYTAATRSQTGLTVLGSATSVAAAAETDVPRGSGRAARFQNAGGSA
ncbi:exodeoxyribonuclease V subunit alpha [Euzebya pacifica]|uniref:exodeoxyribonuclease V subunit alpha n=1 Tax=Euzebya pacifica TaxID=1608957 RepID=UPI0030FBD003